MNEITVRLVANGYILEECARHPGCAVSPEGTHVFETLSALNKWMKENFSMEGDTTA